MVHPSIPCQWSRSEEDGRHVRQGDRGHLTESPRHLEEKPLSDGQRRTAQSRTDFWQIVWTLHGNCADHWYWSSIVDRGRHKNRDMRTYWWKQFHSKLPEGLLCSSASPCKLEELTHNMHWALQLPHYGKTCNGTRQLISPYVSSHSCCLCQSLRLTADTITMQI